MSDKSMEQEIQAKGLPQGLIVAELDGHSHAQTHIMVS